MKKNKFLLTDNVFIDSSVFEEQNFLSSTKIHSLLYYAQTGVIKIHITTVSKLELFNRIKKRIEESRAELKKIQKNINAQNVRIIKNLGIFKKIDIPELFIDIHQSELKEKFDSIFKLSNVNTIRTANLPITQIVQNYYSKKPPFHNSGKQNEFIDAIILKTLELWCERNKVLMYVLSKDPDFLGYKSDSLIIQSDLSSLLENITKYYNQKYKLNRIATTEKAIENNKKGLELLAFELIQERLNVISRTHEISKFCVSESKLIGYKTIAFRTELTEVECTFRCRLSFYVFKEGDFKELKPRMQNVDLNLPLFVEIYKNGRVDLKKVLENADYIYEEY